MFSFRETLKNAFLQAVGKKADYDIILSAAQWVDKGVLIESDVAEIQSAIDEQYQVTGETTEEEYNTIVAEQEAQAETKV